MNEDELLKELARVAAEEERRDHARLDPRWERLSAGTLSQAEEAELRALAAESEEAREAYEAFRPLTAERRAGIVKAIRDQRRAEAGAETPLPERRPPGPRLGALLPFRRWRGLAVGGALVAAAAVVLLLARAPAPPLPAYRAELSGGVRELRSEQPAGEDAITVFAPGGRFGLILRPETAASAEIAARFYLQRGEELRRWEPPVEIDPRGAVRIAGEIGGEIAIGAGEWTLWAVVGRPGRLPVIAELRGPPRPERSLETGSWRRSRCGSKRCGRLVSRGGQRFRAHGLRGLLTAVAGIWLVACSPAPEPPAKPRLEVEYAGCGALIDPGPACVLEDDRILRLWIRTAPDVEIGISADG